MNLSGINFGMQPFGSQYQNINNQNMPGQTIPGQMSNNNPNINGNQYTQLPGNYRGYFIPYPQAYNGVSMPNLTKSFGQQQIQQPQQLTQPQLQQQQIQQYKNIINNTNTPQSFGNTTPQQTDISQAQPLQLNKNNVMMNNYPPLYEQNANPNQMQT